MGTMKVRLTGNALCVNGLFPCEPSEKEVADFDSAAREHLLSINPNLCDFRSALRRNIENGTVEIQAVMIEYEPV